MSTCSVIKPGIPDRPTRRLVPYTSRFRNCIFSRAAARAANSGVRHIGVGVRLRYFFTRLIKPTQLSIKFNHPSKFNMCLGLDSSHTSTSLVTPPCRNQIRTTNEHFTALKACHCSCSMLKDRRHLPVQWNVIEATCRIERTPNNKSDLDGRCKELQTL